MISAVNIFKWVTIEPVMLLYYTSLAISALSGQNLVLQKACHPVDVPLPSAVCDEEQDAQKVATNIETWKQLIVLFVPVFFTLFAGSWSDKHMRRKPLMYLPIIGQVTSDLLSLLNVNFWSWSPVVAALSQSIPAALTGWRSCFLIGVGSYVGDITSEQNKTVRFGIQISIYFIGTPIGAFLFGMVFNKIAFDGVFILCVVLNLAALVYLYFFVVESKSEEERKELNVCVGLMDPRQVLDSIKTVFKQRDGNGRAILVLLVLTAPLTMAPLQGEYSVYYFFLRIKFNWNEIDFGFYAGIKLIVIFIGTLVTVGVFSHLLKISDAVIGMMASIILTGVSLGYAFATNVWQLFVYCFLDFMHGAGLSVVFSTISKIVDRNEFGKVNSMIGVGDALFPLMNIPLYTQLYNYTFTQMPGAFFLISFAYGIVTFVLFGVVYFLQKCEVKQSESKMKSGS